MNSIKNFFAVSFGIVVAVILVPFVALFGLMMLGLTFGMALIAAGTVSAVVKQAEKEAKEAEAHVDTVVEGNEVPA